MKYAKKILCLFLSFNIIYFSVSNGGVVRASSNLQTEPISDVPTVHELGQAYNSRSSATLGLVSQVIGGATVLSGSGALVGALVGAGAVALAIGGAYIVGAGLSNVYDYAKDWAVSQQQMNLVNTSFNVDDFGNVNVTGYADSSLVNSSLSSIKDTSISNPTYEPTKTFKHLGVSYTVNLPEGYIARSSSVSGTYNFYYPINDGSSMVSNSTFFETYIPSLGYSTIVEGYVRVVLKSDSTLSRWVNGYYFNKENLTWVRSSKFYLSTVTNIPLSDSAYTFDPFEGISSLNTVHYSKADSIRASYTPQALAGSSSINIPKSYVGALNPSLSWENGTWVNKETGASTDVKDMVLPFPNTYDESNGFTYDDVLDDAITGDTDSTIPDDGTGTLPDIDLSSITAFLQSILGWLLAFPEWLVTNLVNVITGSIATVAEAIGNIWSWCQALPNMLADWFAGIIEFLQSIGLTLADVLSGIISLPVELAGALTDVLIDSLVYLFVPAEGSLTAIFEGVSSLFETKFPLFGQMTDFFSNFNKNYSPSVPEFKITIPAFLGGGTYTVIDFSSILPYRSTLLGFIRLFLWTPFLIKLYKRIPTIISGGGY